MSFLLLKRREICSYVLCTPYYIYPYHHRKAYKYIKLFQYPLKENDKKVWYFRKNALPLPSYNKQRNDIKIMMTIEEYRAAILQALLDAKNEDALQPLLQGKHRKHSTDLPTTSCKTESYGIRPKTWHQLSSRDKSRKLYSATNR